MKEKAILLILLFLATLGWSLEMASPVKAQDTPSRAATIAHPPVPLMLYGPKTFIQKNAEGFRKEISIPLCDPALPYRLTLRNGDKAGKHKAAFLSLVLNGKTILDSTAFNERVHEITLANT